MLVLDMFFDTNVRFTPRKDYQICTSCVMDTSATEIHFDELGRCNFCKGRDFHIGLNWFPDSNGEHKLLQKFKEIKENSYSKYDCLIGLSGGIDSAKVAFKAVENGLKPLALHIDAGWNTNASVSNVEKVCAYLNMDLHTIVIDWEEMRLLQLAYLESGVMNQDTPQDHALFSSFFNFAKKNKFKYILSGVNFTSELVQPASWGYTFADGKQIKYIAKRFGKLKLKQYPIMKVKEYKKYINSKFFDVIKPLDYGLYNPILFEEKLKKVVGWISYPQKHGESLFTYFFQSVYLFEKFNIDKRRNHLSSLVISNIITRENALKILQNTYINSEERNQIVTKICSKLEIDEENLNRFLKNLIRDHYDLPNDSKKIV